ncbi:unnamed protein product [Ranitomeya imitator]|uniref:G-protein coupled receptors family 1 profile domain-containing protein n=1 Tax=Ranitomeya imitator TaxID=111125 RepID=A0ABN9LLC9_9NEOB|nr:unnamed protein product [Ranitomeya imitator]
MPLSTVVPYVCLGDVRKALTRTAIYTLNLAVADFLYVCSLPLLIYNYVHHDYWPFGDFTCRFVRFQFYTNLHGSIMFLTCMSFQRYMGICHPLSVWHKKRAKSSRGWSVGLSGLFVIVQCIPTFIFASTGTQRNRTVCYDLSPPALSSRYFPYGITLTVTGFLIPFIAILGCYCAMTKILCLKDNLSDVVVRRRKDKAIRMIIIVVIVFAISFFPFHLTKNYLFGCTFQVRGPMFGAADLCHCL